MDKTSLQLHLDLSEYDKLYQDIEILDFVGYSESHKTWDNIKDLIDWKDKVVIDAAGFHGYFSFKVEHEGAAQIFCLDRSAEVLETTACIKELNNSNIVLQQWESKELIPTGDIILFLNCLHHFPEPELTLQNTKCTYGIFEINNNQTVLIKKYFDIISTGDSHRVDRSIIMGKKLLSIEEELIYNKGERLIPYLTHNKAEIIRHHNSYKFFARLINNEPDMSYVTILDFGCGVGHGTKLLSENIMHDVLIYGYDIDEITLRYARQYYNNKNIIYGDLIPEVDYIVSRGVIEHIEGGIELLRKMSYAKMLIIDVPYNESQINKFHVLTGITEESFKSFKNIEFYYEDINGNISKHKMDKPNMLMAVIRK